METILVLTHADETGSALTKASLEAITAGQRTRSPPQRAARHRHRLRRRNRHLADSSCRPRSAAGRLRRSPSPSRATQPTPPPAKPSAALPAATIVLAPSSSRFARVAAGVAHRLNGCIDTHITASIGGRSRHDRSHPLVLSPAHRSLAHPRRAPLVPAPRRRHARAVRRRAGSTARRRNQSRASPPRAPPSPASARPRQDAQTIRPDAKLLFVAGAGWTKKQPDGQIHVAEAGDLILGFLRAAGASLGSSKSLVDQGGEGQLRPPLPDPSQPDRPNRRNAPPSPRASPPAAMAKSRTSSAGASSANAAPSPSTPTAAGPAAKPTSSTLPTPSR